MLFLPKVVSYDVIMTPFNRVRLYSYNINPTKFGEDRMKNGRVIVLTSSRTDCTGNDVIVTKINSSSIPTKEQSCEVSSRSDKVWSSYRVHKLEKMLFKQKVVSYDVTDDVIIK